MREQLKRDAVTGVGWAFLSSSVVRILQVATTLTLAKLLIPEDFGIFTLAIITINAAMVFRDVGFSQVLIYRQGDIRKSANVAFWLSVMSSALLGVLLFAGASSLGWLLSEPRIALPIKVMSVTLVISGMANVPLAMLDKRLQFRKRAVPEVASALSYALVSIVLAALGFGAWSLIIGWIVMTVVNMAAVWAVSAWRPRLEFDRAEVRVIVGYGKHLMMASLATFAFFQIDNAAVGKWLGAGALGFYYLAFTVCNMPATNLAHVINRVMFPTYSKLQDNLDEMRGVYLKTVRYISMAAFPAAAAIFVLADPVIRVFYSHKWEPAIPLFHVLAFYGLIRSIGCTAGAVFMSTGNPNFVQRTSTLQLLIALPLVYPAALYAGAIGVAVLFTAAYAIGVLYAFRKVQTLLSIHVGRYIKTFSPALMASTAAGAIAWFVARNSVSLTGILTAGLMVGLVYGMGLFVLDRSAYSEMVELVSKSREGRESDRLESESVFPN